MANGTISKTTWTAIGTGNKVVPTHVNEITAAIDKLETYAKNVDNCGFTNYCQSCQTTTCQTTTCQGCQGCQRCQACQSCQSYKCQSECINCYNCSDDT